MNTNVLKNVQNYNLCSEQQWTNAHYYFNGKYIAYFYSYCKYALFLNKIYLKFFFSLYSDVMINKYTIHDTILNVLLSDFSSYLTRNQAPVNWWYITE
jgi:hypothetical protein